MNTNETMAQPTNPVTAIDQFFTAVALWRDGNAKRQTTASEEIDNAMNKAAIKEAEFAYLRAVRSQEVANKILRRRPEVEMVLRDSVIGKTRNSPEDVHNDWPYLMASIGEDPRVDVNDYSVVVCYLHLALDCFVGVGGKMDYANG